ncbi:hypothetical protein SEVIR_6G182050v4 [Setaria viridis]
MTTNPKPPAATRFGRGEWGRMRGSIPTGGRCSRRPGRCRHPCHSWGGRSLSSSRPAATRSSDWKYRSDIETKTETKKVNFKEKKLQSVFAFVEKGTMIHGKTNLHCESRNDWHDPTGLICADEAGLKVAKKTQPCPTPIISARSFAIISWFIVRARACSIMHSCMHGLLIGWLMYSFSHSDAH